VGMGLRFLEKQVDVMIPLLAITHIIFMTMMDIVVVICYSSSPSNHIHDEVEFQTFVYYVTPPQRK